MLREFGLGDRDAARLRIEQDRAGRGGALIDRENMVGHEGPLPSDPQCRGPAGGVNGVGRFSDRTAAVGR